MNDTLTHTLETQPPSAKAAMTFHNSFDLGATVKMCAKRKLGNATADDAHNYSANKGKGNLFGAVWAIYRDAKGIPKFQDDARKIPTMATAAQCDEINQAINAFWKDNAKDFFNWGTQVKDSKGNIFGKLSADGGRAEMGQRWTLVRQKSAKDEKEALWFAQRNLDAAKKRLATVTTNAKGVYNRTHMDAARRNVEQWEIEVRTCELEIPVEVEKSK